VSDRDESFFIKELIREQVLMQLREEVPHQIAVAVEKFQLKSKAVVVEALIIVDKPSQKAIVIGKDGARIKAIGIKARERWKNASIKPLICNYMSRSKKIGSTIRAS
jgi:GTP-binding protein Era